MSKAARRRSTGRRLVRPLGLAAGALGVGLLGLTLRVAPATAQQPSFSADDLDKAMKTLAAGFTLVKDAAAKNDLENAKDYLARSREQLATSIIFWRQHKKDDAVQMLRTALRAMDDLDPLLAAERADASAVSRNVARIETACESCHAVYRDQDPVTHAYRVKPESLK